MELALRCGGPDSEAKPVPLARIAERQGIPEQYLRQIFLPLRRAGIVTAVRGTSGGYMLAREPGGITALEVVLAMGEEVAPAPCVRTASGCERAAECPVGPLWRRLARAVEAVLSETTLADLVETGAVRGGAALARDHALQT